MDTKIKNIAYLIVTVTVFNYFYNVGQLFERISIYHLYLVFLCGMIVVLFRMKLKQNEEEHRLIEKQAQLQSLRWNLNQVTTLDMLAQLEADSFKTLVCSLFKSYDVDDLIEDDDLIPGVDAIFWQEGEKTILRAKSLVPVDELLVELQICNGIKCDADVLADEVIFVTTMTYPEDVRDFAKRNLITLIDGPQLLKQLETQRVKLEEVEAQFVC